jgi:two-component system NtrC family sensor kinase
MRLRTRIGTKFIFGVCCVTVLTIGLMALVILPQHRAELVSQLIHSADRISETIKNSARDAMLQNRRDQLRRQIEAVGRQEGIRRVRLFNKEGTVMLSSDPSEVGHAVDKRGEACYACHVEDAPLEHLPITARSRTFREGNGQRLLGTINPIQNEPSCYTASCHAHSPTDTVLGVLDVSMPLGEVDAQIARSQARMGILAALTLVASALLLWWLNRRLVVRPVAALVAGTRRVAEGDLTTTIRVTSRHELGELARAFNTMTQRLSEAQHQLTQADKLASIGRLAAGVAHEINSPLTGVLSYASFLHKRAESDPSLKEDLDVIVRETKRCREIVKGLLDFARPTPPRRQPTDLNDVVRRAIAVVMNELTLHRVALNLDLASDLPPVPADENQIQQVVVNLLLNAVYAIGEEGGEVRIASCRSLLAAWGHAPIRRAHCPRGCDLRDPDQRIGGLPAIHLLRAFGDREARVFLDPVYGRFNHLAPEPLEEGAQTTLSCPKCRTVLTIPGRSCGRCGSTVFAVQVPKEGQVEWCTRKGCHWSRWEAREAAGSQPVVEVEVDDSGQGIPPEVLAHLFEPFFSTKGARGTGLGLAVTWGIVEGHGGTIEVASEVGRGSRFTVRLPLEKGEAAEVAAA